MKRLLLLLLLTASACCTSCRLANQSNTQELSVNNTTIYCLPEAGCTYLTGYHDCVRDNETPKCVFFNVTDLKCKLCFNTTKTWKLVDQNKSGAGPRLCEVD